MGSHPLGSQMPWRWNYPMGGDSGDGREQFLFETMESHCQSFWTRWNLWFVSISNIFVSNCLFLSSAKDVRLCFQNITWAQILHSLTWEQTLLDIVGLTSKYTCKELRCWALQLHSPWVPECLVMSSQGCSGLSVVFVHPLGTVE